MTQERASIESCRAAIGTHDEDGMVEIEASILEDALDYLESELAAREKRMREVAEDVENIIIRAREGDALEDYLVELKELRAKLLEGIEAE